MLPIELDEISLMQNAGFAPAFAFAALDSL